MSETITVVGNIATQPEHRQASGGLPITSFRLASNGRRLDKQTGTWVDEEPSFYKISAFRALAENAFGSLVKGQRIIVTGRLRIKQWEAGEKKGWDAEIDADAVGPDLLFGTTVFTRVERRSSGARGAESVAESWSVPDTADEPAGAGGGFSGSPARVGGDDAERTPVLVGAHGGPADELPPSGNTPF